MADAKLPFFLLCEKKLFAYLDSQLTLQQHLEENISFSHEEKKYYLWGSEGDNYLLS